MLPAAFRVHTGTPSRAYSLPATASPLLPDGLALNAGLVAPKLERSILLTAVAGQPHSPAVANVIELCRARAPRAPG